ncbi:MAG: hypothetical protein ABW004_03115 [Aeromicrobium sp.]
MHRDYPLVVEHLFDYDGIMDPNPTIETMRTAARALTSADARQRARAIQAAQDALDAAKAEALAEIDATQAYEVDGAHVGA